jgi:hypothetical protein
MITTHRHECVDGGVWTAVFVDYNPIPLASRNVEHPGPCLRAGLAS